ncbi:hypothetical protein RB195_018794 [Necator americanus]|uniref:Uncharacterized protein n=1 Tax=Necator americanus TaxID=51031 RepID=A0ABR1CBA4_NECAM
MMAPYGCKRGGWVSWHWIGAPEVLRMLWNELSASQERRVASSHVLTRFNFAEAVLIAVRLLTLSPLPLANILGNVVGELRNTVGKCKEMCVCSRTPYMYNRRYGLRL